MPRLTGVAVLALLCFTLALAGGWGVMWLLAYLLMLLVMGSFLWAQLSVDGLELRRRHGAARVQVGDTFVEQVILEGRSVLGQWWPRLWLEVRDLSTLPDHNLDRVLSLGPLGRRVWEIRSACRQRGRFTLGPVWVTSGDPFGLFRASRKIAEGHSIIVYPRTVDLPRFRRVPGELPGGTLQGIRVQYTTP